MYVYRKSPSSYGDPPIWTVGYYNPDGTWEPDSDHSDVAEAADHTAWLNGNSKPQATGDGVGKSVDLHLLERMIINATGILRDLQAIYRKETGRDYKPFL